MSRRPFRKKDIETTEPFLPLDEMPNDQRCEFIIEWFRHNFENYAHTVIDEESRLPDGVEPCRIHEILENEFYGSLSDPECQKVIQAIDPLTLAVWVPTQEYLERMRASERLVRSDYDNSGDVFSFERLGKLLKEHSTDPIGKSEAELRQRKDVEAAARKLLAEFESRCASHGAIGHNGPLLDDNGNPIPDEFTNGLYDASAQILAETDKAEPDVAIIANSAARLQRLLNWLEARIDLFADAYAQEMGKFGAKATVGLIVLSGFSELIHKLLYEIKLWLEIVIRPF